MPNIANTLQKDNIQCMYGVISAIAERMRFHQMQDKAEFSLFVKNEIYEKKANIQISSENAWTYKRFPAHNTLYKEEKNKIVRFGLNVKPNIGLFKKLDDLCLKYDAFDYKIIDERLYNHRGDPIIIYAKKETQKEMQDELEEVVRPYRRRDEYDMVGYSNLGTGVFAADSGKYRECRTVRKNPYMIDKLGDKYAYAQFMWDDIYSICKIIEEIGISDRTQQILEELKASIGKLKIVFPKRNYLIFRKKVIRLLSNFIPVKSWRRKLRAL